MCRAELKGALPLRLDRLDDDDLLRAGQSGALDRSAADATEADDDDRVAGSHVSGVNGGPPSGGDTAPEQTGARQRDVVVDLDDRCLGDGAVLRERADERHDTDVLPVDMAPVGAVELGAGHDHRAEVTEILVAGGTEPAATARRQERCDDVVAGRQTDDTRADLPHDARTLVAADERKRGRQVPGADVLVGVAQAGGLPGHQHLAVFGWVEVDLFDGPVGAVLPQNRGVGLHPSESRNMLRPPRSIRLADVTGR